MNEPIDIAFLKQYCRIDSGLEDNVLEVFISAARELAETYCNTYFISQLTAKTFRINEVFDVPVAAVVAVSGFYTSVLDIPVGTSWFAEYVKGFTVNRDYPIDYFDLPAYTVTYAVTVDPADVPAAVKVAIAKIAAELYENREFYGSHREMGVTAKTLLAPYRVLS
ncbi:head-tail connector protein [Hymenobacter sp. UYCo722]|uniref:head-tail connector protein n=1 Tax=Hymenobacter sp. UYCo722 TaxID=3156335 RepID=UPI00339727E1